MTVNPNADQSSLQVLYTNRHIPDLTPETNLASMISFTSPPTLHSVSHSHTNVSEDEDFYMDDDHDPEAEDATITTPGESITSARAFMR